MLKPKDTSWGPVADWYDNLLNTDPDNYQRQVILPNLLRLVDPKPGQQILDLACGSGFFAQELAKACPTIGGIVGVDVSTELINLAKKLATPRVTYVVSPAHQLAALKDHLFDTVISVLAIQNIAEVKEVFAAVKKVLKPGGKFIIVMNHPAFRIPGGSAWVWDEGTKKQ